MATRIVSSTSHHNVSKITVKEMDYHAEVTVYTRVIEITQNINGQDITHEIVLFSEDRDVLYLDIEG